jgi:hypothetical protein
MYHSFNVLVLIVAYQVGGSNPPSPKFWSLDKAERIPSTVEYTSVTTWSEYGFHSFANWVEPQTRGLPPQDPRSVLTWLCWSPPEKFPGVTPSKKFLDTCFDILKCHHQGVRYEHAEMVPMSWELEKDGSCILLQCNGRYIVTDSIMVGILSRSSCLCYSELNLLPLHLLFFPLQIYQLLYPPFLLACMNSLNICKSLLETVPQKVYELQAQQNMDISLWFCYKVSKSTAELEPQNGDEGEHGLASRIATEITDKGECNLPLIHGYSHWLIVWLPFY